MTLSSSSTSGCRKPNSRNRGGDRLDGVVVVARVVGIGFDVRDVPHFDVHGCLRKNLVEKSPSLKASVRLTPPGFGRQIARACGCRPRTTFRLPAPRQTFRGKSHPRPRQLRMFNLPGHRSFGENRRREDGVAVPHHSRVVMIAQARICSAPPMGWTRNGENVRLRHAGESPESRIRGSRFSRSARRMPSRRAASRFSASTSALKASTSSTPSMA